MSDITRNDKTMDAALAARIEALQAGNDENNDGSLNAVDLKAQLNRIEAKLDLQDAQNRTLLRHSKFRMVFSFLVILVLVAFVAVLAVRMNDMYTNVMDACEQINTLSDTLQEKLNALDTDDLAAVLDQLPALMDSLSALDTDSLNAVMERLPSTMDALTALQQQLSGIAGFFGGLTG